MTDSPDNTIDNVIGYKSRQKQRVCRAAYTLNNEQPVLCTIIGDQPLFYLDVEEEYLEDEFLNEHEIEILEQEVSALRKEIDLIENNSDLWAHDEEEKCIAFHENALSMFSEDPEFEASSVDAIIDTLGKSRLAKAFLETMQDFNVTIHITDEVENAFYDRQAGKILINENLDQATKTLLCARELRRHWQHRQGALIHPLMLTPDHAVLINRVQVCDLVTSMIRIAWELQLSGEKAPWEKIEDGSLADLGRAFAREAFLDFRTINNGVASASLFEAWFLSERCLQEDKILIQQMLADYQGFVFEGDTATEHLTAELIAAIGEMPYGKNYLSAHVATIMGDPIFTDVRDRSNANFLWFIKFERSFRETEQKLQNPSAPTERDVLRDPNSKDRGFDHAAFAAQERPSAEIIQLFEGVQPTKANDADKKLETKKRAKSRQVSGQKQNSKSGDVSANIVSFQKRHSE